MKKIHVPPSIKHPQDRALYRLGWMSAIHKRDWRYEDRVRLHTRYHTDNGWTRGWSDGCLTHYTHVK